MSKFRRGDKVRVSEGAYKGKTGVVIDPCVQISQSDWPYVLLLAEDGHNASADEDSLELAEDPYEYAMQAKDLSGNWYETDDPFIRLTRDRVIWADRESRERLIEWVKEEMGPDFRLVKRRKAGPVEDA